MDKKKRERVSSACDSCRRKKIKCNGLSPCINCVNYNCECTFGNQSIPPETVTLSKPSQPVLKKKTSSKASISLDSLAMDIRKLRKARNKIDKVKLTQIELMLKDLQDEQDKLNEEPESTLSIETRMLRNQILHPFHQPKEPIEFYFGLYHPLLMFSKAGMSWMLKHLGTSEADVDAMETFTIGCKSINPYFVKYTNSFNKSLNIEDITVVENVVPIELMDEINNSYFDISDTVGLLKKESLLNTAHKLKESSPVDKFNLFAYLLYILPTKVTDMMNFQVDVASKYSVLQYFMQVEESLLKICNYYVVSLMFTQYDYHTLIGAIYFIKSCPMYLAAGSLNNLLAMSVSHAMSFGLNRLEFNVGITEEEAELKRNIWCRISNIDMKDAISSGKLPHFHHSWTNSLSSSTMQSLLPFFVPQDNPVNKNIFEALPLTEHFRVDVPLYLKMCRYKLGELMQKTMYFREPAVRSFGIENTDDYLHKMVILMNEFEAYRNCIDLPLRPGHPISLNEYMISEPNKFTDAIYYSTIDLHIEFYYLMSTALLNGISTFTEAEIISSFTLKALKARAIDANRKIIEICCKLDHNNVSFIGKNISTIFTAFQNMTQSILETKSVSDMKLLFDCDINLFSNIDPSLCNMAHRYYHTSILMAIYNKVAWQVLKNTNINMDVFADYTQYLTKLNNLKTFLTANNPMKGVTPASTLTNSLVRMSSDQTSEIKADIQKLGGTTVGHSNFNTDDTLNHNWDINGHMADNDTLWEPFKSLSSFPSFANF